MAYYIIIAGIITYWLTASIGSFVLSDFDGEQLDDWIICVMFGPIIFPIQLIALVARSLYELITKRM